MLSVLERADLAGRARLNAGAKAEPRMSVAQEAIHTVRWSSPTPQAHVCALLLICKPNEVQKLAQGFPPCHAYMDVHASAPHRRRPSRHLPLVMANSLSKERVKVTSKECLKSANWTALA